MDQRASEIRLAQWEQIVLEGNQASVTKREWCRQNGINEKSFFYWQRKIRLKALEARNTPSAIVPVPDADSSKPTFVELPFPGGTDDKKSDINVLPELMIQVDDCKIFVTASIQESTLQTVMKVIRNA